jgi:signal transduction histidine kinase
VQVRTAYENGQATPQVTNTGPVVPTEIVPALIEPFRRQVPDRTRTGAPGGSGLGLSIVAAIAHGGGIDLTARRVAGFKSLLGYPPSHRPDKRASPNRWQRVPSLGGSSRRVRAYHNQSSDAQSQLRLPKVAKLPLRQADAGRVRRPSP